MIFSSKMVIVTLMVVVMVLMTTTSTVVAQPDSDGPFPSLMIPARRGYLVHALVDDIEVWSYPPGVVDDDANKTTKVESKKIGTLQKGWGGFIAMLSNQPRGDDHDLFKSDPAISLVSQPDTDDAQEWLRIDYRDPIKGAGGKWYDQAWIPRHASKASGRTWSCKEGETDGYGMDCSEPGVKYPLKFLSLSDDMSDGEAWETIELISKSSIKLQTVPGDKGDNVDGPAMKRHEKAVIHYSHPARVDERTWWLVVRQIGTGRRVKTQQGWIPDQLVAGSVWPTFRYLSDDNQKIEYFDYDYDLSSELRENADKFVQ